jgi:hypothetical protein
MGRAIFYDIKRINTRNFYELRNGVYEGRIIKISNSGLYSVQLRNDYVINNVLGEEGLQKYQNVTIITHGKGNVKASIIDSGGVIQYSIPSVRVV